MLRVSAIEADAGLVEFRSPHGLARNHLSQPLCLPTKVVHLWAFNLDGEDEVVGQFAKTLSDDEIERAKRFMRMRDRNEFILAHGVMRVVLAKYCGIQPSQLRFANDINGKPSIASEVNFAGLPFFNLAHSNGRMLLAITATGDVGVDLECEGSIYDPILIASRWFDVTELSISSDSPLEERRAIFFRYWVAKEAVLKAQGQRLGIAFDQIRISWDLQGEISQAGSIDRHHSGNKWNVKMLECEQGWYAAVAASFLSWTVAVQTALLP